MITKNDFGEKAVFLKCFCNSPHCSGDIYIQPDILKKKPCFYVGVTDSGGNTSSIFWLDRNGIEELIAGLQELLKVENDKNNSG